MMLALWSKAPFLDAYLELVYLSMRGGGDGVHGVDLDRLLRALCPNSLLTLLWANA